MFFLYNRRHAGFDKTMLQKWQVWPLADGRRQGRHSTVQGLKQKEMRPSKRRCFPHSRRKFVF